MTNTRESINMISNVGMERILGQMARAMRDNLSMIFEMDQEYTGTQMVRLENSCGKMGKFNIDCTQKKSRFIVVGGQL
jgi:hypothetical protein